MDREPLRFSLDKSGDSLPAAAVAVVAPVRAPPVESRESAVLGAELLTVSAAVAVPVAVVRPLVEPNGREEDRGGEEAAPLGFELDFEGEREKRESNSEVETGAGGGAADATEPV